MNKLAAVNEILGRCGLRETPSLDTDGGSQAAIVETILEQTSLQIQGKGWSCNTVENKAVNVDGSNNLPVPDGTISIKAGGVDSWRDLTQRGGKLYDRENNTYEFDEDSIYCDYIIYLEFECLPYEIRKWITLEAAKQLLVREGDRLMGARSAYFKLQMLLPDLRTAKVDAQRYEAENGKHNILDTVHHKIATGWRQRIPGWSYL